MRLLAVAAVLMVAGTAPLGAAEVVRVPASCSVVGNRVVLTAGVSVLTIVGRRDHKSFRTCTEVGCRGVEIYRFDVLCGGRQVNWRRVAGQLFNFPATRDPSFSFDPMLWATQSRAEPDFAPVEELGAQILSLMDNPMPQPAGSESRPDSGRSEASELPKSEPGKSEGSEPSGPEPSRSELAASEPAKSEPAKSEAARAEPAKSESPSFVAPSAGSESRGSDSPGSGSAGSESAGSDSAGSESRGSESRGSDSPGSQASGSSGTQSPEASGSRSADARDPSLVAPPPRQGGPSMPVVPGSVAALPAEAGHDATDVAGPEARSPLAAILSGTGFAPFANPLTSAAAAALAVLIVIMTTVAVVRWISRWLADVLFARGPRAGEDEDPPEPDDAADAVRACSELMREINRELLSAMTAVNSLKGDPVLRTALTTELESIRRSVGFTRGGRMRDDMDLIALRAELALNLQAVRRIIDIAAAAGTSLSGVAADVTITTRPQAFAFLGVNASVSEVALKKLVNALRLCWHPDLAEDEEDRRIREERTKQINAAWDVITGKHIPA